VAARKNRPVLYEVVGRTQPRESVWKRPPAPAAPPPSVGTPAPAPERPSPFASVPRVRWARFSAGRLHLDLGWPGMAATGIVLVFLLVIAFDAGRRLARPGAPGSAPAPTSGAPARVIPDRSQAPDAGDLGSEAHPQEGLGGEAAAPSGEPAEEHEGEKPSESQFEFQHGYSYVVVQHFRKSQMAAAKTAGNFLGEHGVPCVIVQGADLMLIASEPLLLEQSDARAKSIAERHCEELKTKIRTLGKEYAKDHGYAFEQCYPLTLKK
jgi:hypothetical protein